MTKEEAIKMLKSKMDGHTDTSYEWCECVRIAIKALEQEPCEDEYIKVPKKALKYRTAGMVAYNAEWLKNHFDIERAVICGAQEPCEDAISRQAVLDACDQSINLFEAADRINDLPPVNPQAKTEHCKDCKWWKDSDGIYRRGSRAESQCPINRREVMEGMGYCYMFEPQERSD